MGRGDGLGDLGPAPGRHSFTFSHVFRPDARQVDVYDHVARPIVADVLSGYNGTVFMYGQTGSGKTHTMFGDVNGGAWATGGGVGRTSAAVTRNEEVVEAEPERTDCRALTTSNEEESTKAELCLEERWRALEEKEFEEQEQEQTPQHSLQTFQTQLNIVQPKLSACDTRVDHSSSSETFSSKSAAAAPSLPAASSSFCRTCATVTPLGELQHINTLQSNLGGNAARRSCVETMHNSERSTTDVPSNVSDDALSGVIPRAVHDIFTAIANADSSTEFDVQMFFVEVYMEQIRDLLTPNPDAAATSSLSAGMAPSPATGPRKLQLREDVSTNSFYIEGCRNPHVSSASDVLRLVKGGLKRRATSATSMNETSSRSHCLLNLTVKRVDHVQGVSTVGKLYLVDLAGSEKVGKTNAKGLRLEEAKLINKSLSTLGMVIMSLTDYTATHTPYRDSVLTKILKDSLGGNSHTALVICCSPSSYNAQETLSTLRFGARAKAIENKAVVNRDLTAAQLRRMLETAKGEIERLHAKVQQLSTMNGETPNFIGSPDFPAWTSRKLTSAAMATESPKTSEADMSRISELLEERAAEQQRLQNLRAQVAQLQDSLNSAQDIINTLQDERDGYIDKVRSFQEEINLWEDAHTISSTRLVTQDALLQQSAVLLRNQASEIKDLIKLTDAYRQPLQQAREAAEQLHARVFRLDMSHKQQNKLVGVATRQADRVAAGSQSTPPCAARSLSVSGWGLHSFTSYPLGATTGTAVDAMCSVTEGDGRRSTNSTTLLEGDSPNPRCQSGGSAQPLHLSSSQPQHQHRATSHYSDLVASASIGGSPGRAAVQQWMSRTASMEQHDNGASNADSCGSNSISAAAQAERIRHLEEQFTLLQSDHAALQQQHKETLTEMQSKQRILDLRRRHLAAVQDELKREYVINKELRMRLDKERNNIRAPIETARNDANYWRRRYEELASRKEQRRTSECQRGSLRFVFPPPGPMPQVPQSEAGDGKDSDSLIATADNVSCVVAKTGAPTGSRSRLSVPGTSSGVLSSRVSGEDVLLSLSSDSTPSGSTRIRRTTDHEEVNTVEGCNTHIPPSP
ncbi:hypothetical protein JKF63_05936 [Porcisia hertigi]|uniref:Kinesin motor domain-containing protein n=1 Tax=Porcisia hertigi TaxID=2761500 RepID=A0A836IQN6_9TRYP|nr:hypothetical protein JKF63_05936 [Porcisia hertigi]